MTMQTDVLCSQVIALDITSNPFVITPLKDLGGKAVGRCRIKGVFVSTAGASGGAYNYTFARIYDGNPVSTASPVTPKKYDSLNYSNGGNPNISYQLIPGEGILVNEPYVVLDCAGASSPTINCYVTIFYG